MLTDLFINSLRINEKIMDGALNRLKLNFLQIADTKENDKAIALMLLKPEQFNMDTTAARKDKNQDIELRGIIIAPPESPIAGYILFLGIRIPPDYPFKPPKMWFLNKVWHPKVSIQFGSICIDILYHQWSPALTLETVLLTI